jgi:uncharacterized protein DUF262/uncharacterized protein DUF1524
MATSIDQLQIKTEGLGLALRNGPWFVPKYQREYKWEEKNVKEFFGDIENAIKEERAEYFMGSIVIAKSGTDHPEIVDGQQRLATTAIFCAAARDVLSELKADEDAGDVQREYLMTKHHETREPVPRLRLSDADHEFFEATILRPPAKGAKQKALPSTTNSHRRIETAYRLLREYVNKVREGSRDPVKEIFKRITYVAGKVKVIWVQVPDEANAYIIFETLNDRGLDLAVTDLIKNFLFGRAGTANLSDVQHRWISMYSIVESAVQERNVKHFLRHQWASQHGLTREKDLFDEIKKDITTPPNALKYASCLLDDGKIYAALTGSTQPFWADWGGTAKRDIDIINKLEMQRISPLLLAVVATFTRSEAQKALHLFVSWGVRFLVAPSPAGTLEKFFSNSAKDVREKRITKAKALHAAAKSIVPTDSDFETYFSSANVTSSGIARYLLRELEVFSNSSLDPALVPDENTDKVNLEHVLPRSPKPGTWVAFDADAVDQYSTKFGNLCLLLTKDNNAAENEEFSVKKPYYAKSSLKLTKGVAQFTDWTPASIAARQKQLAILAPATWPNKV